jgi:hypothetical protein
MRRPMTPLLLRSAKPLRGSAPPVLVASGVLALAGLALAPSACKSKGPAIALAKGDPDAQAFANVPVPPADGPKLVALRDGTPVVEQPGTSARKLGELRVGSVVARSVTPYSRTDCEGGWYAVRPHGFVCAGAAVSLDAGAARAMPAPPDLGRALPYRYGRARMENVPLYARTPLPAEQLAAEPDLAKVLARGEDKDPLGAGANDVPLDARGIAAGPPVLLPTGDGMDGGRRTIASYFVFTADAPAPPLAAGGDGSLKAGALRKGSGVAIAGTFAADSGSGPRRFGVTPDGLVVPIDRLKPTLGSTWHGLDLEKLGLPIAFVHKLGVHTFSLAHGKAVKHDDELERRAAVPLTGRFRTVDGQRFEETRDGDWLRAQDLVMVIKRSKFPDFARGTQKWLDISVANQTLTAYEGTKPVYATLVSSGRDQLKDPQNSAATARGTFRVRSKHVTSAVDSREVQNGFDITAAPWVIEFEEGNAITGNYWGDGIGEPQSFHDVELTPIDAHRVFAWSDPQLPEGWQGVYDTGGDTTMVNVRP